EPGQGSLGERDQPHRHVDADDRHGRVDPVLDDLQVAFDVAAAADAGHHGREPDCHIRRHGLLRTIAHRVPLGMLSTAAAPLPPNNQSATVPPRAPGLLAPGHRPLPALQEGHPRRAQGMVSLTGSYLLPSKPGSLHAESRATRGTAWALMPRN